MMNKTISTTVGVLVAFTVWCAALMLAILIVTVTLHVLVIGGFTVYHLLQP
jgi:hypothetical protein